jgi:hypothetical protein
VKTVHRQRNGPGPEHRCDALSSLRSCCNKRTTPLRRWGSAGAMNRSNPVSLQCVFATLPLLPYCLISAVDFVPLGCKSFEDPFALPRETSAAGKATFQLSSKGLRLLQLTLATISERADLQKHRCATSLTEPPEQRVKVSSTTALGREPVAAAANAAIAWRACVARRCVTPSVRVVRVGILSEVCPRR